MSKYNKIAPLTPDMFEERANDIYEDWLQGLMKDERFAVDVIKNPDHELAFYADEGWRYVYTQRGDDLAQRMRSRLCRLGEKLFPGHDFDIDSSLYVEG